MAATSVTKNITEHKSVLNVLENRLLHIEHFDFSGINVQTNQWGKHSIEIAAIWAGSLCSYFTFHTNSQSCCSNLLFKSNQSHYSNISHTTYNPETSYIIIIYILMDSLFSVGMTAELFRAQDLTGGHSRTVLAGLPSMIVVPGENGDKWDLKPVTGTQGSLWATGRSQWLMMPSVVCCLRQTPLGFYDSIIVEHFYLCAIRLKSCRNHYITFLKRDCTGFALNIIIVVGFIVIMKCDLFSLSPIH